METNNNRMDNSAYISHGFEPEYQGIDLNGLVTDCNQARKDHPAHGEYQQFFGKEA